MASENAAKLRKAMKGWGTNEKALIEVIGPATTAELIAIKDAYKADLERDLIADIKDETSGNFERVLVSLFSSKASLDAYYAKKAMKGLGTNEKLLSEVLCLRSRDEIKETIACYEAEHKGDLVAEVENEVGKKLGQLYTTILTRGEPPEQDIEKDITALYKAGEDKFGTNESAFIRIIGKNPRSYNEQLYTAYAKKYGKALDAVIHSEMSGNLGTALAMLVTPLPIYYSQALHKSMDGMGTDDSSLIRLIITQKEKHLPAACERFLSDYKKTVKAWVKDECKGDYKNVLVSIIDNFGAK
jgi:hypothetical protein